MINLAVTHPQLASEWNTEKNGELTPEKVSRGSGKNVWWVKRYDDPKTGKHFDFEWKEKICNRANGNCNCPFLSGHRVWPGYNDLATTHPQIAAEWYIEKNGTLTPEKVSAGSKKKVWWKKPYDDPKTGKHFDFEWEACVNSRAIKGYGCPFLSGQSVWKGFNDLATTHPELVAEWDEEK
ncbi:MAG: hypothetical protein E7298_14295, partial [Lachnospiraceae bacterium]|nr:hypothetical protein [Lachnospiraceae bacterium]